MFVKGSIHFTLINEWFTVDITELCTLSEDVSLAEPAD
jgi:hypothetical protein